MKKRLTCLCTLVVSLFLVTVIFFVPKVNAAPLKNIPQTLQQPNGEFVKCFASGDEFFNWLHDKDGYIIVQDNVTGYYVYAVMENTKLVPSKNLVGHFIPTDKTGIKTVNVPTQTIEKLKNNFLDQKKVQEVENAPKLGGLNNLVVFVKFAGQNEYADLYSSYDNMFNNDQLNKNSMHNYYDEVSNGKLNVTTGLYPLANRNGYVVSITDSHTRGYYSPYNAVTNPEGYLEDIPENTFEDIVFNENDPHRKTYREFNLLKNSFDAVSYQIPSNLNLDGDGDGEIDNVCFIVQGAANGWNSLLWPHKWSMTGGTYSNPTRAYLNGKVLGTFNLQLSEELKSSGVGVLCHEMFHSIGAPDLYHYDDNYGYLQSAADWDIMENDKNPPQNMTTYMKFRYGKWITSIPEIKTSGTYSLKPSTSADNNCFMIKSPYSTTEYFMVEYRKKSTIFENSLPGQGLIVYRINTKADGKGNRNGPVRMPDELYIFRPGGSLTSDGSPKLANLSSDVGRTAPQENLFLNNGTYGGVKINNVGTCGDTISFNVEIENQGITSNPNFSLNDSGEYYSAQTLSLSCTTQGAVIRYTIDGSEPTTTSTLYTAPITIDRTMTIKAKAFATGLISSSTVTKTYSILQYPESAHNYKDNFDYTWTYALQGDQRSLLVTFDEQTNVEENYDYIYVMDAAGNQIASSPFTGVQLAGRTIEVPGNTVKIRLVSDGGANEWGFKVNSIVPGQTLIAEGYPKKGIVTGTRGQILIKAFNGINARYVVLPSNATKPSAQQIVDGQDSNSAALPESRRGSITVPANVEGMVTINNLTPNTNYKTYIMVAEENQQFDLNATPYEVEINTISDITAPSFINGYPNASHITDVSADLNFNINEEGNVYFVIVPKGSPVPTISNIKDGLDGLGAQVDASKKGTIHLDANIEKTIIVSNLTPGTEYDVYAVSEDNNENLQLSATKFDLATIINNNTPPAFMSEYPMAGNIYPKSFEVLVKTNKSAKVYYAVYRRANGDGFVRPTIAGVKIGANAGMVKCNNYGSINTLANIENKITVFPVNEGTTYDLVLVCEDANGNVQECVSPLRIKTPLTADATPKFVNAPIVRNITNSTADLSITSNKDGVVYFVAIPAGERTPGLVQVRSGKNSRNQLVPLGNSGRIAVTAGVEGIAQITGLQQGTSYDLYILAQDNSVNPLLQLQPTMVNFITNNVGNVDINAPAFNIGYPSASTTDTTASFVVSLNETSNLHYVVVPAGLPAPDLLNAPFVSVQPNTLTNININGLNADTSYDVYFMARDNSLNASAPVKISIRTQVARDITGPTVEIATGKITDSSVDFSCLTNENGKLYYVVLPANQPAPSPFQIKGGQNVNGEASLLKGSISMVTGAPVDLKLNRLLNGTTYEIYFVSEDSLNNFGNVQHKTILTCLSSQFDFNVGYPTVSNITSSTAQVSLNLNKDCTAYFVAIRKGERRPNPIQIRLGKDGSNRLVNNTLRGNLNLLENVLGTFGLTQLAPNTTYELCLYVENTNGPKEPKLIIIEITTPAAQG